LWVIIAAYSWLLYRAPLYRAALAQSLQSDLTNEGFDAWLDASASKAEPLGPPTIEHALDEAGFVLALMTSGSYISEICRAEQLLRGFPWQREGTLAPRQSAISERSLARELQRTIGKGWRLRFKAG